MPFFKQKPKKSLHIHLLQLVYYDIVDIKYRAPQKKNFESSLESLWVTHCDGIETCLNTPRCQPAQHSWQNGVIFDCILRGIFVNSMIMSEKSQILVSAKVGKCTWLPNFFFCHAGFGIMPKPKFRQARHASRGLPNWTKYYSNHGLSNWKLKSMLNFFCVLANPCRDRE